MSKLDTGVTTPSFADIRVADVLRPLGEEFSALAREHGLGFRAVASSASVRSDPALLRRILQNFLANALRYTGRGRVLIGCRRRGGELAIEVWDTGPGIPEAKLREIFVEFHRLETGTGSRRGTGPRARDRRAAGGADGAPARGAVLAGGGEAASGFGCRWRRRRRRCGAGGAGAAAVRRGAGRVRRERGGDRRGDGGTARRLVLRGGRGADGGGGAGAARRPAAGRDPERLPPRPRPDRARGAGGPARPPRPGGVRRRR